MKLLKLDVVKAFGYLPINVIFNDDLTFLVGPNGSGKTTALRLIHAILGPAFEELYSIAFDRVDLTIEDNHGPRRITVTKRKDFCISIEGIDSTLNLPEIGTEQLESLRGPRSEIIHEVIRPAVVGSPVFEYLQGLTSPLFLGLERRLLNPEFDEEPVTLRARHYSSVARIERDLMRGSMSMSLLEVHSLVQNAYRRYRRTQETMTTRLRRAVVLSAFRYTEIRDFERVLGLDPTTLLGRRDEIESALDNLGISGPDVRKQLNDFFERLQGLLLRKTESDHLEIELLTNKAQIERIEELIRLIDEHRVANDNAFSQLSKFIMTINSFFADTRKEIEVDQVGALKVVRPDKVRVGIEALSSGEKQLLVIFGHLFFNRPGGRSNVFIIDEPELSLHLRWQELFVEKAISANASAQLVLATHSPEIVGKFKDKALNLGIK